MAGTGSASPRQACENRANNTYDKLLDCMTLEGPTQATNETGVFTGSGSGSVTGNVIPVGLHLSDPANSDSACAASDFAGLDFSGPNDIALVQRGACSFGNEAMNAEDAGAKAVIIFNEGDTADRMG